MPDVDHGDGEEQDISRREISRWKARKLAEEFDGCDPFPKIPCALLSADDIIKYANKTGMIAPFFPEEDWGRMKKASYEGKIGGEYAYKYDDGDNLVSIPVGDCLVVGANSIVFVECDIDFNLPNFIAMRFNLHIRHVHRGLLLGTGPLVDPGYKGRLCIPLHNLTDKDYPIPVDKGLIWMEFTKTSGNLNKENERNEGRVPGSQNLTSIQFILRAAEQHGTSHVPIRSSIRGSIKRSEESAKRSEESARAAENKVKRYERYVHVGAIAIAVALAGIVITTYGVIMSAYNSVSPQASEAHRQSALNEKGIEVLQLKVEEMKKEILDLRNQTVDAQNQNDTP